MSGIARMRAARAIAAAVLLALPLAACRSAPPMAAPAPGPSIESPTPWIIDPPGRGIPR